MFRTVLRVPRRTHPGSLSILFLCCTVESGVCARVSHTPIVVLVACHPEHCKDKCCFQITIHIYTQDKNGVHEFKTASYVPVGTSMGGGSDLQLLSGSENVVLGIVTGVLSKSVNYSFLSWKTTVQQGLPISLNPRIVYRGLPMACINLGGTNATQFGSTGF